MEVTICRMDETGDTQFKFNLSEAEALNKAQELIDNVRSLGGSVVGRSGARITDASKLEQDNVAIPRIVGG